MYWIQNCDCEIDEAYFTQEKRLICSIDSTPVSHPLITIPCCSECSTDFVPISYDDKEELSR